MSSHHFVKEGQEPPLVVLDWNSRLAGIASELLAWQPQLIVKQELVYSLVRDGLKPDIIIGNQSTEFDFLYPLTFLDPSIDVFKTYPKSSFIIDLEQSEAIGLVRKYKSIIYTSAFRVFSITSLSFEKWMPPNKSLFYFDNENQKIIRANRNGNDFFSLSLNSKSTVILEEL